MVRYSILEVENAILEALSPLKIDSVVPSPDAILRTLKTYQGELEKQENVTHLIDQIKGSTPAAFTIYAGSKFENVSLIIKENQFWGILIVDESLRGTDYARRGSTTNVGAYTIIQKINEILMGSRLGLNIMPLEIQSVDPLYFDTSIAVYSMLYMAKLY